MQPVAGPQAPPCLPGHHFRHDLNLAGQIGKPAEQGRGAWQKTQASKLCLGLFLCSVIFGGVTALPPTSSVSPAAMEQCSSGIWAELVEKAEKKELVELEPWLNGCPCPLQRNHSCLQNPCVYTWVFKSKGETFLLYSLPSGLGDR